VLVIASDTAGLRDSGDTIEAEGVRRALARAREAHLILLLQDGNAAAPRAAIPADLTPDFVVWNKSDLHPHDGISISLKTGAGVAMLQDLLQQKVQQKFTAEAPALTRARHRVSLTEALAALDHAGAAAEPELLAEDLRLAMRAVGRITGRVDVEEVLDFVFRDFCIGK
jgi:tRNA modification GTPase